MKIMNNLGRDLRSGEEVVVMDKFAPGVDLNEKDRIFICDDGFGMQAGASGSKIFGRWKKDYSVGAIRGEHIDTKATIGHQAKNRLTLGSAARTG
jgi:hypothetical protein